MSEPVNTSTEAVERVAKHFATPPAVPSLAALLRALVAERDAANRTIHQLLHERYTETARADAAEARIKEVLAVHTVEDFGDCVEDGDPFPCQTVRILTAPEDDNADTDPEGQDDGE